MVFLFKYDQNEDEIIYKDENVTLFILPNHLSEDDGKPMGKLCWRSDWSYEQADKYYDHILKMYDFKSILEFMRSDKGHTR